MNGGASPSSVVCRLRPFIAGTAPRSQRRAGTVRRICEAHLKDRYELEIVDIYQQPSLAQRDGILAAPTLLRVTPKPERRVTGDLSSEQRVLQSIHLIASREDGV